MAVRHTAKVLAKLLALIGSEQIDELSEVGSAEFVATSVEGRLTIHQFGHGISINNFCIQLSGDLRADCSKLLGQHVRFLVETLAQVCESPGLLFVKAERLRGACEPDAGITLGPVAKGTDDEEDVEDQ